MINNYLQAGFPVLSLITIEYDRVEQDVPFEGHWSFFAWDCQRGIRCAGNPKVVEEILDPVAAIHWLNTKQDTVLFAHNLHLFLDAPEVIQSIQNGTQAWKARGNCLIMVSPMVQVRPELSAIFTVVDLPLPGQETLFALQQELGSPLNVRPNRKAARMARGLTEFEAECAYALSLVQKRYFSSRVISELKSQIIRKTGLLEVWEPESMSKVGGLGQLKAYIRSRAKAFAPGNEHLPRPRGLLLVGIPGTGKTLSCKAAASILGWPLLRLDIGALKGSLVGESEKKIRQATQIIESFGECVVMLDEIEKGFAGVKSSGETDAGTTSGMFSHFLWWLQEHRSPVFVMATANDISKLPPETIRAGRFDAVFMVDLPSLRERRDIIRIMNDRYYAKIPMDFADRLDGWSGSEIEQLAKETAFTGLLDAFHGIVPLARTMREDIDTLRNWARTRARPANTPDDAPEEQRKIRVKLPQGSQTPTVQ
ncbi:MAG: AAA family ATPase [Solidesulfovibrio sp.]|uniref:AAA family ATPase n=1 Tax=Solidesulfovibrio sp. TaxID=2910990 RepID=UPI00315854DF